MFSTFTTNIRFNEAAHFCETCKQRHFNVNFPSRQDGFRFRKYDLVHLFQPWLQSLDYSSFRPITSLPYLPIRRWSKHQSLGGVLVSTFVGWEINTCIHSQQYHLWSTTKTSWPTWKKSRHLKSEQLVFEEWPVSKMPGKNWWTFLAFKCVEQEPTGKTEVATWSLGNKSR